jgi:hypothetical protein
VRLKPNGSQKAAAGNRNGSRVAECGKYDTREEDQLACLLRGVDAYALRCLVLRAAESDKLSERSFFFGSMGLGIGGIGGGLEHGAVRPSFLLRGRR